MTIFDYFKKKGIDTVDTSFYRKIDEWESWYQSNVAKFHFYRIYTGNGSSTRRRRQSLGMAKQICCDIADLLMNERVKMTIGSDATYDAVMQSFRENNFFSLCNEYQERKAATGTVAYVPYLDDVIADDEGNIISGKVRINFLTARNIFPITWQNGEVTEVAFAFPKTYQRRSYLHIQYHRLNDERTEYILENNVIDCTKGSWSDLAPEKWADIPVFRGMAPEVHTGSPEPQFVIDKLNIVNNADRNDPSNPMGIAIFANCVDVLRTLDMEYDSYGNEFDLGRKRIFVAPEMMQSSDGSLVFDTADTIFYQLPDGYFDNTREAIHEVNMDLRIDEHSKAINDSLNYLSMKCGFGQHHYQFESGSVKTATEVISENSEMYRMLKKHELILEEVLKKQIRIIIRLKIEAGEAGIEPDPDIQIDFDDSIIQDSEAERTQDRQDVSMGAMSLAEYRAKWYAETLEKASTKVQLPAEVIE